MLELIKDTDGTIKAALEWYRVDKDGNFDNNGDFAWINEMEISPAYRNNGILKSFAKTIMTKCPELKFAYFWRQDKYPGRRVRLYHKARWLKLVKDK